MVVCSATSGADPDIDSRSLYQHHRQELRDVGSLVAAGGFNPRVDRVLSSEDVYEGHRAIEARDVVGKVVIRPIG